MNAKLVRSLPFLSLLAPNLLADPLDSWHWYPVPTGDALRAVAYGGGTFVTVGDDIATSTNGLDWTANPTRRTESLIDVTYGQGVFVAVGWFREAAQLRTILTSTNGLDWSPRLVTTNASMLCVAYGAGKFVAAGWGKSFMVSTDGLNWTQHDFAAEQEQVVQSVLFANGIFVAVGNFGGRATIWSSPDGTNWTQTYSVENDTCYGVAYGGGIFVATSYKGKAITSADGVSWTARAVTGYGLGQIAYGNGTFVTKTITEVLLTSSDGVGWTAHTSNFRVLASLIFADGIFLAVDAFSGLRTSVDGVNWINRKRGTRGDLQRIIYANGSFVAVGHDESILSSPDGVAWTQRRGGGTNWLRDIAYGNGLFVVVGEHGTLLSSADSSIWAASSLNTDEVISAVGFGDGTFVAAALTSGGSGEVWTSTNAVDWAKKSKLMQAWPWALAFGNGIFAIVGGGVGGGGVWTSNDGSQWTHSLSTPESLWSVIHANGVFVAVGGFGTAYPAVIITSTNGADWVYRDSGVRDPLDCVTFADGMFVAIGANALTTSKNGVEWTGRRAFVAGTGVAYGNNTFVAVSGRSIFQSDPIVRLSLGQDFSLSISGMADRTYRIEATSDLDGAAGWQTLTTLLLENSPFVWRENGTNLPDKRFYRVVSVP
jgi:hypothetical protein